MRIFLVLPLISMFFGCRTPQHRNEDIVEHDVWYNLESGSFDDESMLLLGILYTVAPR